MKTLPLRLHPGDDVRKALEAALSEFGGEAAMVVSGIGSLSRAQVRYAGREHLSLTEGDLEVLTLSGTVMRDASHLHASLSDADGVVSGGHLGYGCIVRTTAELLLAVLDDWTFTREPDPATGYDELVIRRRPA